MKTALAFLLLLAAVAAHAQRPAADRDAARTAIRCATYVLMASKSPDARDVPQMEAMIDTLGRYAQYRGATETDIDTWAQEFVAELGVAVDQPGSTFVADQGKTCRTMIASLSVAAADTPPGDAGHVGSRHPSGRPATIVVQEHAIAFDDGAGTSCDAPVLMTQAGNRGARIRAQSVWLSDVHPQWTVGRHETRYSETPSEESIDRLRIFSWHQLEREGRAPMEACFDMTADGVPELKALAR